MSFQEGQGVIGRLRFRDGGMPEYDRPFLIVTATDEYIEVLNISSIKGKERKLAFPTNRRLIKYNPPFIKPSFVKLDSLTRVPAEEFSSLQLLCGGKPLDSDELRQIKNLI